MLSCPDCAISALFRAGTSVGIIIPCMPLLVSQLHIPPSEFGLVISAFGLSKLIGNIPSGYFVEKYGRKPIIMAGLGMCGVGLGSIGEQHCQSTPYVFVLCAKCAYFVVVEIPYLAHTTCEKQTNRFGPAARLRNALADCLQVCPLQVKVHIDISHM